eukprot:10879248-Alexandrium_andersonii.AAC.1
MRVACRPLDPLPCLRSLKVAHKMSCELAAYNNRAVSRQGGSKRKLWTGSEPCHGWAKRGTAH